MVSPFHPDFSRLYKQYNFLEQRFTSERKAIQALPSRKPDLVVADFIYGYGNNYAGVNLSNLDVFLYSLQKQAPDAKVIVLADKDEHQYAEKLKKLIFFDELLTYPVSESEMDSLLKINGWTARVFGQ